MASGPAERARLLGLVREYVLEHGIVDLSLSELARSIGSNNRMLLYHFGSLDRILTTVIDELLDRRHLLGALSDLMVAEKTPGARVTAAWRHISHPDRLPYLRIFFGRFGMASDSPPRYQKFLEQTRGEWTDAVAAALTDDDRIEDPQHVAMAIVALWRGLQVLLIAGEPREAVDLAHTLAVRALLPPTKE
ncbi:TetR/AcrR family transcriptional regulator [Pseudonocardia kujensis]|uniref:TetR/AcrR family transcriptional regulator n=1 Tax=Pseudonocardia kujensis TaxID=1128675 RepID=UPI001E418B52|nr:TetR/AcrR family transcriptional regulator [Pseudonocardia kujensis]MCE0765035.1 TetR/AcrR family transcriptional regulator [Pseudonocardia kujensis]